MSYEALGDERFQLFCQSLLTYEFPELRCFPVNQADGGRDAMAGDAVFQVKYSTNPAAIDDPAAWLRRAIARERPKMDSLAERGVKSYYLLTNVPGTGRLDAGTMDRVSPLLADLPFQRANCWWRADIDARLAKHGFSLKWVFRELLTTQDLIDGLLFGPLGEDRQRRSRTLQSFLNRQHADDAEVRFRQIEFRASFPEAWLDLSGTAQNGSGLTSVAEHLLNEITPNTRTVLYGAPGQGKSTLGQFVCQIHRRRLLELSLDGWPHLESPLRLPIRVDLKDLAEHLNGGDPFRRGSTRSAPTLPGFLADLISFLAGGDRFDVTDLKAALEHLPVLLVLDGLDEVPQVELRDLVIEEIDRGLATLEPTTGGIQALLATRPAQYGRHELLDGRRWRAIVLADLQPDQVISYARTWFDLQALPNRERDEHIRVLQARMRDDYFADLVRNGMQLTIVLRLLMLLESWLPERRAELYSEYFRLYMSREAAKSAVVSDHAKTLTAFHRVLGFQLHVRAQAGGRPEIAEEELKELLAATLANTTADRSLINVLFDGVVERIAAIVSRRSGFFEFEVQPMREYFAAQHLYATAPEARYGKVVPGTKRDIFLALAKDPYWTNVLRFFAGEFSEGESNSLAFDLTDFMREEGWSATSRPREVATQMVNDRVFFRTEGRAMAVAAVSATIPARTCLEKPLRITEPVAAQSLMETVIKAIADPGTAADRRLALTKAAALHVNAIDPHHLLNEATTASPERGAQLLCLLAELHLIGPDVVHRIASLSWLSDDIALMLLDLGGPVAWSDPNLVEKALSGALGSGSAHLTTVRSRSKRSADHPVVVLARCLSGQSSLPSGVADAWPASPATSDATAALRAFFESADSVANDPLRPIEVLAQALGRRRRGAAFDQAVLSAVAEAPVISPYDETREPTAVALVLEARRRSGVDSLDWWEERRARARSRLLAQAALLWAEPAVLEVLGPWIDESLDRSTPRQIAAGLELVAKHGSPIKSARPVRLDRLSPLATTALALRAHDLRASPFIRDLVTREGALGPANSGAVCLAILGWHRGHRPALRGADLAALRTAYGAVPAVFHVRGTVNMTVAKAETVLETPEQFPLEVVQTAEALVLHDVEQKVTPLGDIAEREGWFGAG